MSPRTKLFLVLAVGALVAMIALGILGYFLDSRHLLDDPEVAKITGPAAGAVFFALFLLLGFSLVPLAIRLFIVLQTRIGNAELWMVRGLHAHENGFTYGIWAVFLLGLVIAAPVMLRDLFGVRPSVGASQGTLVARIGMTVDEMRQRSSLQLVAGTDAPLTGTLTLADSPVFDFEIADTAMRFPSCRYYFIDTGDHGDRHLAAMSIGISPQTMTRAELVAAHHALQERFRADGWSAGRYLYDTPEKVALHGGATSSGEGFLWREGETLLRLSGKRMDDEQPGEDVETAGAWIQVLELRPADSDPDLDFSPPAR